MTDPLYNEDAGSMEPRYNEPLYNKDADIMNDIRQPSCGKMYGKSIPL